MWYKKGDKIFEKLKTIQSFGIDVYTGNISLEDVIEEQITLPGKLITSIILQHQEKKQRWRKNY